MFLKVLVKKKELELEVERLKLTLDLEKTKLKSEYDILAIKKTMELTEKMKLAEMEMNDKLNKQATLYNESLQKMNMIHSKDKSELETRLATEYYGKLSEALAKMNLEGSSQSKFVQELSLKMFDKALEKPNASPSY